MKRIMISILTLSVSSMLAPPAPPTFDPQMYERQDQEQALNLFKSRLLDTIDDALVAYNKDLERQAQVVAGTNKDFQAMMEQEIDKSKRHAERMVTMLKSFKETVESATTAEQLANAYKALAREIEEYLPLAGKPPQL